MKLTVLTAAIILNCCYAKTFSSKDFNIALGAQARSLLYKRGIITYGSHQITPIYSINLFRKDLFIAGSALYHNLQLLSNLRLLTRLNSNSTKDDPLYTTQERKDDRVRRKKTNEIDFFLQYDFSHSTYMRIEYSKDLTAHFGHYSALQLRYDLRSNSSPSLIQPGFFISAGQGNKDHNEYLYGKNAQSGINNLEYGLSIVSPKAIDNFWPTLKITHFKILGDKNRQASYVDEKEGFSLELLFAKRVL